jgi:hypothetical protein
MSTILPIVNNNGTSHEELISQRRNVADNLEAVLLSLRQMAPHGRDYQTDPTGDQFRLARTQHERRVKTLLDLRSEIQDEALTLYHNK